MSAGYNDPRNEEALMLMKAFAAIHDPDVRHGLIAVTQAAARAEGYEPDDDPKR
jgi:hypothetical protein